FTIRLQVEINMSESSNAVPGQAGPSPAALPDPSAAAMAQNQAAVGTTQVPAPAQQGFGHFIAQSDIIGKSLFVVLLVMSLASWYLIVVKSIANMRTKRRSKQFLDKFWQSTSLDAVANEINTHGANDPFSHLASH